MIFEMRPEFTVREFRFSCDSKNQNVPVTVFISRQSVEPKEKIGFLYHR